MCWAGFVSFAVPGTLFSLTSVPSAPVEPVGRRSVE